MSLFNTLNFNVCKRHAKLESKSDVLKLFYDPNGLKAKQAKSALQILRGTVH